MAAGEGVPAPVGELPQRAAPPGDHLGGKVSGKGRGPGPGARRVAEHVVVGERHRFQAVAGAPERFVRLAGESDDHVGPEPESGHRLHRPVRKLAVVPKGVAAAHPGQHAVVAALHRKVEIAAERSAFRHAFEEAVLDGGGLDRGDPDPLHPRNLLEPVRNVGERPSPAPVAPDVDPGEHELPVAGLGQFLRLADQVVEAPAALPAARVGNDAERAEEVAAVLHLQVGAGRVVAPGGGNLELVPGDPGGVQDDRLREFPGPVQIVRERLLELRPHDHVHSRDLAERVETRLGVATRHHHEGLRRPA